MFKRVDRRLKRKAEDEALGIDGEFKQALGIPDTDSDESDSSSDSSEDEAQAEEVEVEDGSGDDDDEAEVRTVAQILENPLYNSPQDIDMTACFVCPAKLFKGPSMIQIHLQSKHHIRRFSKFKQRSALASPQDDAREHVPSSKDVNESSEGLSNRAKKKNTRRASQAEKRRLKQAAFLARKTKREATSQKTEGLQDRTASKSSSQNPPPKGGKVPTRKKRRTEKPKSLSP